MPYINTHLWIIIVAHWTYSFQIRISTLPILNHLNVVFSVLRHIVWNYNKWWWAAAYKMAHRFIRHPNTFLRHNDENEQIKAQVMFPRWLYFGFLSEIQELTSELLIRQMRLMIMFSVASQHPIMQWDTLIKTYFRKPLGKFERIAKHHTIHKPQRKNTVPAASKLL